jgi:hypothetical protein
MDELHYITPSGYRMNYIEFSYDFVVNLSDPLQYFFIRFDLLHHLNYFYDQEFDIYTIKVLQEDNIRNLPIELLAQNDIIQLGQLLRQYHVVPTEQTAETHAG